MATTLKVSGFSLKGISGVRLQGVQPYGFVYYSSGVQGALVSIGSPGSFATTLLRLNPYFFATGSVPFNTAANYVKFRFTRLKLIFQSRTPTSSVGALLYSYIPDGAYESGDIDYATFYKQATYMSCAVWNSTILDVTPYLSKDTWYYRDWDDGSDAGKRLSFQGGLIGLWDTNPTTGYQGYIYLDFDLELLEPYSQSDVALSISDALQKDVLRRLSEQEQDKKSERKKARLQAILASLEDVEGKVERSLKRADLHLSPTVLPSRILPVEEGGSATPVVVVGSGPLSGSLTEKVEHKDLNA
jgi:hypothetical protein